VVASFCLHLLDLAQADHARARRNVVSIRTFLD